MSTKKPAKKDGKAEKKDEKKPVHKLTLFLLKTDAPSDEECLTERPYHSPQIDLGGSPARLFMFRSDIKKPRWLSLLSPVLNEETLRLFVSSGRISALLFFPIKMGSSERRLVLALGHGAHRLDDTIIDTDFGRDACLSLANTEKLISIDEQQFKDQLWKVKIQATHAAGAASFTFDPYSIVTRITAEAKDAGLGKRISGAEAFIANPRLLAADIPEIAATTYRAYRRRAENVALEWANRITRVSDPMEIEALNSSLIDSIKDGADGDVSSIVLTAPRVVEWEEAEEYVITGASEKMNFDDFPEFSDFLPKVDMDELSLDYLKSCRLHMLDGQEKKYSWSLYRCLTTEVTKSNKAYVLANGNWYEANKNFLKKIDGALTAIPSFCPFKDAKAKKSDASDFKYGARTKEADFNVRATSALNGALFDRKLHRYPSVSQGSTVEPCDIFTRQGHFIHVKRYKGSSPLSHLFFQGLVASICLGGDPRFRTFMCNNAGAGNEWVKSILGPKFKMQDVTTVYGVASGTNTKMTLDKLPVFSRIALAQTVEGFKPLGIAVHLWLI